MAEGTPLVPVALRPGGWDWFLPRTGTAPPDPLGRARARGLVVAALLAVVVLRLHAAWDPPSPAPLLVEVTGQVGRPGLFAFPSGATLGQALAAARGPGTSMKGALADGDCLQVQASGGLEPCPQARSRLLGRPLDPNTATAEALATVPGLGEGRARAIVEEREAHGPFRDLSDLDRVSGLGPATVQALSPWLTLPPALEEPPKTGPMDVNSATAQELCALPGIGPVLAARMVEERERGPFRSVRDLRRVKGIGKVKAARLAPLVVFGEEAEEVRIAAR